MPKIYYPDNFKIEVVKYYKMHRNIGATLEKYGIARRTLFKWKKKYEENHFFRVSKKPANTGHKAQSHLDKLNKIVAASKELKCGVTSSITEKVAEIRRLEGKYSIHVLCEALQIPRGTYYNRKKKGDIPNRYELADKELSVMIREIFYHSKERFGRNPIKYKLQEQGFQVSKTRISRLMKEMGLEVKSAPYTMEHKKSLSRNKFRNLIRGEFSPEAPNLVWASDITYVKVKDQYMFVCVVIDLFSRKILSYGISSTIDTVLTMNTFDEAFEERGQPQNLIFHSDQGVQYTSYAFRTHLEELKCRQSFSAPGYPYDNSVCESFFNTLKKEAIYYHIYDSAADLAAVLDEYIEYYNEIRMHRTLKMKTPSQVETEFFERVNL